MQLKPAALFFCGILFFLLLVYYGLYATEKGLLELTAGQGPPQAFSLKWGENQITLIFAGRDYLLSFK
ncbi:MAG: hypothetical protein GX334_08010 [Firmicutes bacterium]|nr:hypothetical protein [Bacillota bacterium]